MVLIDTLIPPKNIRKMSKKEKFARKVGMKFHHTNNQREPISGYLNPALQVAQASHKSFLNFNFKISVLRLFLFTNSLSLCRLHFKKKEKAEAKGR